jgi:hypothetical protein
VNEKGKMKNEENQGAKRWRVRERVGVATCLAAAVPQNVWRDGPRCEPHWHGLATIITREIHLRQGYGGQAQVLQWVMAGTGWPLSHVKLR